MLQALSRVQSASGFPNASGFHLFRDAQFGRDSLEVAEDLLVTQPNLARIVIQRLAELQGTLYDDATEEEPGKIHHEHRALVVDGHPIGEASHAIFRALARQWNLAQTDEEIDALGEITYYGTVDATPLYVRLVDTYCNRYGRAILAATHSPRHGGATRTIQDSVHAALEWIEHCVEHSDLGLLEWRRRTPRGHPFQAWKDGAISYVHLDGSLANPNAPMASIEVQGLAYDALSAAQRLFPDATHVDRERWAGLAARVQRATMDRFWMPKERFFAMALDRDPDTGDARQVKTIASNPGALLDSTIFDTLPEGEQRLYMSAIVKRVFGADFLTAAGVRCMSLVHRDLHGYAAYQGPFTVWHKETFDIAMGLRRQGFLRLADDLETRVLNAINVTGGATEFLYVTADGRVDYLPFAQGTDGAEQIVGTNIPEMDQAWSISAALAIKWRHGHQTLPADATGWSRALEDELRSAVPHAHPMRTDTEIEAARNGAERFFINTETGWEMERMFISRHPTASQR